MASVDDLGAEIASLDTHPSKSFRVGVVSDVDLAARPPTLTIGEGEFARPMQFLGSVADYHTGQTVQYLLRTGAPLVIRPLPMTGEDPLSDDYEGDTWHEVSGGVGFTNSWVNYGAPYDTAAYVKQTDGWVRLKGLVKLGSSASAAIFTLPAGYRPPFDCWFSIGSDIGARLRITTAGVVSQSSGGSTAYASLNGVTFPTAWNEAAWLIPGIAAPWAHNVASIGETPEAFVRDDGWVWLKGIASGETSAPSTIAQMPQECVLRRNSVMLPSFSIVSGIPALGRTDMRYTGLLIHNNSAAASTYTLGGLNWFGHISTPIITWTTPSLASGWAAYASSPNWLGPGYTKDHFGVVHLSGLATSANANPTTIFTLPAGYRPAADQVFASIGNDNLAARVDVLSTGAVRRIAGASGFVSLDGISFRAAA